MRTFWIPYGKCVPRNRSGIGSTLDERVEEGRAKARAEHNANIASSCAKSRSVVAALADIMRHGTLVRIRPQGGYGLPDYKHIPKWVFEEFPNAKSWTGRKVRPPRYVHSGEVGAAAFEISHLWATDWCLVLACWFEYKSDAVSFLSDVNDYLLRTPGGSICSVGGRRLEMLPIVASRSPLATV